MAGPELFVITEFDCNYKIDDYRIKDVSRLTVQMIIKYVVFFPHSLINSSIIWENFFWFQNCYTVEAVQLWARPKVITLTE